MHRKRLSGLAVTLVVMGDLARSPRTLGHLTSLLAEGARVDVVCQIESLLPTEVEQHPGLRLYVASAPAGWRHALPRPFFLLYTVLRLTRQALWLFATLLFRVGAPDWILVQNPPAIPVLVIARRAARLRGARLMLDWHNLGYSLLELRIGASHALTRWAKRHELRQGASADWHICVSQAMADWLQARHIEPVTVFHDQAGESFIAAAHAHRGTTLTAIEHDLPPELRMLLALPDSKRPGVLVSGSSWTSDEDHSLLLEGLRLCDRDFVSRAGNPALLVLLTGKGPGKAAFELAVTASPLRNIRIATLWLAHDAYPRLLALADLGLSLHRSSSGLDIPMKVTDMLGAGIPVCALDYGPPLREILHPDKDAFLFRDARELADGLRSLFHPQGEPRQSLRRMRDAVRGRASRSWNDAWATSILPLFDDR